MVADLSARAIKLFMWRLPQSTVTIFAQPQLPMHGGKSSPSGLACARMSACSQMQEESCQQHSRNNELSYSSGQETDKSFWGQKRRRFPQK